MKLYELTKGDTFTIPGYSDEVFIFEKIDGVYSVCFLDGYVIHLEASTPVVKVKEEKNDTR